MEADGLALPTEGLGMAIACFPFTAVIVNVVKTEPESYSVD